MWQILSDVHEYLQWSTVLVGDVCKCHTLPIRNCKMIIENTSFVYVILLNVFDVLLMFNFSCTTMLCEYRIWTPFLMALNKIVPFCFCYIITSHWQHDWNEGDRSSTSTAYESRKNSLSFITMKEDTVCYFFYKEPITLLFQSTGIMFDYFIYQEQLISLWFNLKVLKTNSNDMTGCSHARIGRYFQLNFCCQCHDLSNHYVREKK